MRRPLPPAAQGENYLRKETAAPATLLLLLPGLRPDPPAGARCRAAVVLALRGRVFQLQIGIGAVVVGVEEVRRAVHPEILEVREGQVGVVELEEYAG